MENICWDLVNNYQPEQSEAWIFTTTLITTLLSILINGPMTPPLPISGGSSNDRIKLAILGMEKAGKTTFLNWLRYKRLQDTQQTSIEKYQSFDFNGTPIDGSIDIGGGEAFIKSNYQYLISNSQVVVFCFDVHLFLSEAYYRNNVLDRSFFIDDKMKEYSNKKYYILGTHFDQTDCRTPEQCKLQVVNLCTSDTMDSVSKNLIVCSLTDRASVNEVVKQIFNKTL